MVFGDHFPSSEINNFITNNLTQGCVFKIFCKKAEKEKRFIFMGLDAMKITIGSIYINTEINENFAITPQLKSLHVKLTFDENTPYIDHDCFAACNGIIPHKIGDIIALMRADLGVYKGHISEDMHKHLKGVISKSPTIKLSTKKDFGLFYP